MMAWDQDVVDGVIKAALACFVEAKAAEVDIAVDLPEQTITVTLRRDPFPARLEH